MPYPMKRPKVQKFRGWKFTPKKPEKRIFHKNALQRDRSAKLPGNGVRDGTGNPNVQENNAANLVSWNTEGKSGPEEIDKTIIANQKLPPDFVLLQNTKLPAAGGETEHFKWYSAGEVGSAVLVNKKSKWEVKAHDQICDQIVIVKAKREVGNDLTVISCYIPPVTDYRCKDLWDKLSNVLKEIPSNVQYVIGGDFNAQIGRNQKNEFPPASCGLLIYHEDNDENGAKLLKLVNEAHLRIASTHGPNDKSRDNCFTYKDGETKTQQDLIIIPVSRTYGYARYINLKWVPEYKHAMSSCEIFVGMIDRTGSSGEVNFILSAWNIQGATPSKVDTILQEQDLEVICVQELFLTSDDDVQSDHYVWLSSKRQWAKNVGILVKKSPDILVNEFTVISESLCIADIVYHSNPVKVISCHLPLPTDPRHETAFAKFSEVVRGIPADTVFFVAGDLGVRNVTKEGVYDKDNLACLKKLVEETKTNLVTNAWGLNGCPFLTSKINELKMASKPFGRRIAFYESSILCIRVSFNKKTAPSSPSFDFEGNLVTRSQTSDVVDGVTHRIITIEYHDPSGIITGEEEGTVKPSAEDVEKYSNSSPSVSELGRILKDLVLFNGVTEQSNPYKSKLQLLVMSFLKGNFGKLTTELVEISEKKGKGNVRGISRIKWNGLVLSETAAPGKTENDRLEQKTMRRQNANFLYSKLGQHFYQVKAKVSFFCKGQPPMLIDDPRYSDIFQKVDKTKCPTVPEALKYIEDFFTEDSDAELVFDKDFTKAELEEIKEFAKSRNLGYRFFASSVKEKEADQISVFIRRSPQYLRDKLMCLKEDAKYLLIPPSGLGENYDRHAIKYEVEHFKEEEKLVQLFWKKMRAETRPIVEQKRAETEEERPAVPVKPAEKPKAVRNTQGRGRNQNESKRGDKRTRRGNVTKRQYQENFTYDDPSRFRTDHRQLQNGRQAEGPPPSKRLRQDSPAKPDELPPKVTWNTWQMMEPLLIVWPLTICSRLEDRPRLVLEANFPVEYFEDHHGSNAVVVRFPMRNGTERRFNVSVAETKNKAADIALQKLLKHSSVIKPNPAYLCDGGVPNFIRYKVPCQTYPRSYIILTHYDTGPLNMGGIREIFDTFKSSFNEDLFFDKDGYTFNEKMMIIEEAPKSHLNVRHFGDMPGVINRYVCVYKTKPKEHILEDVLKMRGAHPKYTITTDRLPPYLGLNVF